MEHLPPSPGFSIPSIGTPLERSDQDEMILPSAQPQQVPQQPQTFSSGMTPHSLMQSQTPVSRCTQKKKVTKTF